jgi:hypothetical protein
VIFKVLGILSALIFLLCDTPYLSDTIKGKIQPHRVMWGVVLLLNIVGFANQYAAGARNSLWLFGAGALMTGAIFLASLKNGVGGYAKLDIFSLAVAIIGSVLANVLVAIIALVPAFVKARKYPETENGIAYIGGLTSSLLAAISVGKIELILLLLPITSVLLQVYMVYLLYARPNLLGKNAKA